MDTALITELLSNDKYYREALRALAKARGGTAQLTPYSSLNDEGRRILDMLVTEPGTDNILVNARKNEYTKAVLKGVPLGKNVQQDSAELLEAINALSDEAITAGYKQALGQILEEQGKVPLDDPTINSLFKNVDQMRDLKRPIKPEEIGVAKKELKKDIEQNPPHEFKSSPETVPQNIRKLATARDVAHFIDEIKYYPKENIYLVPFSNIQKWMDLEYTMRKGAASRDLTMDEIAAYFKRKYGFDSSTSFAGLTEEQLLPLISDLNDFYNSYQVFEQEVEKFYAPDFALEHDKPFAEMPATPKTHTIAIKQVLENLLNPSSDAVISPEITGLQGKLEELAKQEASINKKKDAILSRLSEAEYPMGILGGESVKTETNPAIQAQVEQDRAELSSLNVIEDDLKLQRERIEGDLIHLKEAAKDVNPMATSTKISPEVMKMIEDFRNTYQLYPEEDYVTLDEEGFKKYKELKMAIDEKLKESKTVSALAEIEASTRFNFFGEYDKGGTWQLDPVKKKISRKVNTQLDVTKAVRQGGLWMYAEGEDVLLDIGDLTYTAAVIEAQLPGRKYAVRTSTGNKFNIEESAIVDAVDLF